MEAMAALIIAIAVEVGVPSNFALAIALEENWSLNPNAVSKPNRDGSVDLGLMQLNSYYFGHVDWRCPDTNARTGVGLLRELMSLAYLHTYWGVAVSYNAGSRWAARGQDPPPTSVVYANRVMDKWAELEGVDILNPTLRRQR